MFGNFSKHGHSIFSIPFSPSNIHDPPLHVPRNDHIAIYTFSSVCAAIFVHPLDYIKTRIQTTSYPYTPVQTAIRIYRLEGLITFTYGLRATLLRQFLNNGVRASCYVCLYDRYKKLNNEKPDLRTKIKYGIAAGMLGAFAANPAEVILIRIMAASAPRAYNHCQDLQALINNRYKGIVDAAVRIIKEDGVRGLWRGGVLVQVRSVIFSCVSIGGYTTVASSLKKWGNLREGYFLHTMTALITTSFLTFVTLPVDIIKSRYQIRTKGVTPRGVLDSVIAKRGLFFWRGAMLPYYLRQTYHQLQTFFFSEEIEYLYSGESLVQKKIRKEK